MLHASIQLELFIQWRRFQECIPWSNLLETKTFSWKLKVAERVSIHFTSSVTRPESSHLKHNTLLLFLWCSNTIRAYIHYQQCLWARSESFEARCSVFKSVMFKIPSAVQLWMYFSKMASWKRNKQLTIQIQKMKNEIWQTVNYTRLVEF